MSIGALYLAVVNITAFIAFMIDKIKAKMDAWRIPEKTLIILAVIGGALGALAGMIVFRHKIRVPKFKLGIPLIILAQAVLVYLVNTALL